MSKPADNSVNWTADKVLQVLQTFPDGKSLRDFPGLQEFCSQLLELHFGNCTYWKIRDRIRVELQSEKESHAQQTANLKPFFLTLAEILMVYPENAVKIWTNYLETKFLYLNIDQADSIMIADWHAIRQEYFHERRRSWKLLQELIRLGTTDPSDGKEGEGSKGPSPATPAVSTSSASPFVTLFETLNPKRLLDILLKHFDTFNHWYPTRFSFEQVLKIPAFQRPSTLNPNNHNLDSQKDFIYRQKMEWILFTFQEELLALLDTMILLTYKKYHLSYRSLENLTKILLSEPFNRLSSLWLNYCPSQSSSTLALLSLAIEQLNFKFLVLFAESLQFWRVFLTKEEQEGLTISELSGSKSTVFHPLSDPKEPIPMKDMINICKHVSSPTSMNQLLLLPSSTTSTTNTTSTVVTTRGGSDGEGMIHPSTRNMLIFLWIKFLVTYTGPESEEEDWCTLLREDSDLLDELYEEDLIEHFTRLTRLVLPTTTTNSSNNASNTQDLASQTNPEVYLESIQATILQEMMSVLIKYRVLHYRQVELVEIGSMTTLIHLVYSQHPFLCESFYDQWERFSQLYQTLQRAQSEGALNTYSLQEDVESLVAAKPLVDLLYVLLQTASREPIFVVRLLLALFPSVPTLTNNASIDLISFKKKSGAILMNILHFATLFMSEEPFELLKQSSDSQPLSSSPSQSGIWLETVPTEIIRNARVIYAHDQYYDLASERMIDREDINVHGGLWGVDQEGEEGIDPPFSLHWYEQKKQKSRALREDPVGSTSHQHLIYPIRGPFYASTGKVVQADYEAKTCLVVWDEKYHWLETLFDVLLLQYFSDDHQREGDHQPHQSALVVQVIELFSRLSSNEYTNLPFHYTMNSVWNKIAWSLFLKQSHCLHHLGTILQADASGGAIEGSVSTPPVLLDLYHRCEELYHSQSSVSPQRVIKQFFEAAIGESIFEEEELDRMAKHLHYVIVTSLQQGPVNGHQGIIPQKRLFYSFPEVLLSLLTKNVDYLLEQIKHHPGLSSEAREVELYHSLTQLFQICLSFTSAQQTGNLEWILVLVQALTNHFQEKWILVLNQYIEQDFSRNHHCLSLKYKLKQLYYKFLVQLLSKLSYPAVMLYQRSQEKFANSPYAFSASLASKAYLLALVTISNLELFITAELDNVLLLSPATMSIGIATAGGTIYDSILQQSHVLAMDQKKLIREYLLYLTSLLSLYQQVQGVYIGYKDLLQKRRLVYSKAGFELIIENLLSFSLLALDQEAYDRQLRQSSNTTTTGSNGSGSKDPQQKKTSLVWKEFLKGDRGSSQASAITQATTAAESGFPLPFDYLVENHYLKDYLSLLLTNTLLSLELVTFFLQQNETIYSNYSEIVTLLYSTLIDSSPSEVIHYLEIFFHRQQGLLDTKSASAGKMTFNGTFPSLIGGSQLSPNINLLFLCFTGLGFTLYHYHPVEAKQIRIMFSQILSQLLAFPEYYFIYDRNLASGMTATTKRRALIEIIGNANIHTLHELLVGQLESKILSREEQVGLWRLLGVLIDYHPNIISLMFSFDSMSSALQSSRSRPISSTSATEGKGLLSLFITSMLTMEDLLKDQTLVLYTLLEFFLKLIQKAKLFPLLGKIIIYLIQQEKFWEMVLKPLLSLNHQVNLHKPSTLLNEYMQSHETMDKAYSIYRTMTKDIGGMTANATSALPTETYMISLTQILEDLESDNLVHPEEEQSGRFSLFNVAALRCFHLMTSQDKELTELQQAIRTYQQQLLLLSTVFHLLSFERYGVFYELNTEVAIRTTRKINEIFISSSNKSKFWSWIQQFLTIHVHHSILAKTEAELAREYSLSVRDFVVVKASSVLPTSFSLLPVSTTHPSTGSHLIAPEALALGFESLLVQHFHTSPVLQGGKFQSYQRIAKLYNQLRLMNYHYAITMVDTLVLYHWKEFLQLFILPGSVTKQYIARYKQERIQQKQQKQHQANTASSLTGFLKATEEAKTPSSDSSSSPSLTSFSSDIFGSPSVGALSPETQQPDASPMTIRESAFAGDKRSYEIVNEIMKKLTASLTTNHSMDIHSISSDPYLSGSTSSSPSIAQMTGTGTGKEAMDVAKVVSVLSSSASVMNIQYLLQSLFGLISISQQTSLLINMIHHQLKVISFKDMNPEKSVVSHRDIGSARLTEDKIEKLLHQLFVIYHALFPSKDANGSTTSSSLTFESEEEKLNAVFLFWKDDVTRSSDGTTTALQRAISSNKHYQERIKIFLSSASWNSTSSRTISDVYSYFLEMIQIQTATLPSASSSEDIERIRVMKLMNQLPYSYYKYQIRSSIFTSILLLFNTIQFYSHRTILAPALPVGLPTSTGSDTAAATKATKVPPPVASSSSGGSGSTISDEMLQESIRNRLSAFQCSFQMLKQLLHYFGVTAFSSVSATTKPVALQGSFGSELQKIQYLSQMLLQIMKMSLPKKSVAPLLAFSSPNTTTATGNATSGIDETAMKSILSDPMYFKQFLSIFFQEEIYQYWLALLQYLSPIVIPMIAIQHDYSALPIIPIEQNQDVSQILPRYYRATMYGNSIYEMDLRVDPQQDSDYLTIATAVIDFSNTTNITTTSSGIPTTASKPVAPDSAKVGSMDNTLQAILAIYDFYLYAIENRYFLSLPQELALYEQLLVMISQSTILQEYQRVLVAQISSTTDKNTVIPSLFMGYSVTRESSSTTPSTTASGGGTNTVYRESLFAKIWSKSIELVEGVMQRLVVIQDKSAAPVGSAVEENSAKISSLNQSILQFLQLYEPLLALPILTIGHYRYSLQQLQLIRQTYHLFSLLQQLPRQYSLYKTYLPALAPLLEVKALTYLSNLAYYTSYSEDFYIESHQIQLLSTGIIMNYHENVPILITEEELASQSEGGDDHHADRNVAHKLFGWREDSVMEGGAITAAGEKKSSVEDSTVKGGAMTSRPSFGRDASVESAHVHFGSDQFFIISANNSNLASASSSGGFNDTGSPPGSAAKANSALTTRQLSTATPPPLPASGTKPASILKSGSRRFSVESDHDYDVMNTSMVSRSSAVTTAGPVGGAPVGLPPALTLPRANSVMQTGGSGPTGGPGGRYSFSHRSTSSQEGRHLDRGTSTMMPPPLHSLPSVMIDSVSNTGGGSGSGGVGGGPQVWKYRWGYYHYSHPYLSFVFLLEKQLLKTCQTVQHFLRLILPEVDCPQEALSTTAFTSDRISQNYPIGKKMIFLSNQSQTLVEGVIHGYDPDKRVFEMILTSNNLIERNVSIQQLKFSTLPLISFQQLQELRTKQDFYRFPFLQYPTSSGLTPTRGLGGLRDLPTLRGTGGLGGLVGSTNNNTILSNMMNTVVAAYDHLEGKINKHQILSTSHLYRILMYFIASETKDRLLLKSWQTVMSTATPTATTSSTTSGTPATPRSLASVEKINPRTANQRLQTFQNSFLLTEYQSLIMETIYLLVANLHHHSYAPMQQEVTMIQQLIDLQHLLSLYTPRVDPAQVKASESSSIPASLQKGNTNNTSSSASKSGKGSTTAVVEDVQTRLGEEWKKYLSYISTWMEEIYYRLEQSIGVDLSEHVPMMTPVKKEGKFRKGLRTPSNWFTEALPYDSAHEGSYGLGSGGYLRKVANTILHDNAPQSLLRSPFDNID